MAEGRQAAGRVQLVEIDEHAEGQRLDNFLMAHLKGVPRTWVYPVLRKGEVRANKGRAKPAYRLQAGDQVRIPPVRQAERQVGSPPDGQIKKIINSIFYEDNFLLIVNKPAGLAVHGGSGLSYGVIEILRAARPDAPFLELVHRLDRETSGCLMLAKRRSALTRLQELQRGGRIETRYLALLAGRIRKGAWRADMPLKKNTLQGGERVVRVDPQGKVAVTRFKVLQRFADATLVEATLETGRTHQIRVHAAANGTPILGDPKYGDEVTNRRFRDLGLRRLFLHAASLRLDWPDAGSDFTVEAPLPDDLRGLLERLNEQEVSIDRV